VASSIGGSKSPQVDVVLRALDPADENIQFAPSGQLEPDRRLAQADRRAPTSRLSERLRITANLFPVLGISPMLGRNVTEDQEVSDDAVIVSYGFWKEWFGAAPDAWPAADDRGQAAHDHRRHAERIRLPRSRRACVAGAAAAWRDLT
jgi:hypothetical protein